MFSVWVQTPFDGLVLKGKGLDIVNACILANNLNQYQKGKSIYGAYVTYDSGASVGDSIY